MITSNQCWLKRICNKYTRDDCECKLADISCIKLTKINALYDAALLTPAQHKDYIFYCNENNVDVNEYRKLQKIEQDIVNFVTTGNNLYIHSNICGNGKTAWSIKLLQAYLNAIWIDTNVECRALFINVPRFLLALKDNISTHNDSYVAYIKKNILKADLVIWDEVATKALTEYEHENILSLINARLDLGKSNIYTSNLEPGMLKVKLGDRLYSRVVNNSIEIIFNDWDKRQVSK